ncbi:hypothetical protein [Amycolatopsis aidingensis]|uniref:hypothetical protein n=1 Tax=Amycolatopsis aidingensis TaxID=2842453 RepID=UPI001C0E6C20|nr:hypothetical protein [Amycolatopsis aidingensis]
MADTENTEKTPEPTRRQLAAARQFVTQHGKPSRAVVEPIGRGGARVVLVGKDGALGDVLVPAPATGEALVAAVDELELSSWDADTVNATEIGARHRRRMAASWTRA